MTPQDIRTQLAIAQDALRAVFQHGSPKIAGQALHLSVKVYDLDRICAGLGDETVAQPATPDRALADVLGADEEQA